MLMAGHETTAATLAGTLAFLAGYSSEQEIVFQEIKEVVADSPDGTLPIEHYNRLPKTRSAFVEATRMIPPGYFILRESTEDTVIQVPTAGEDGVYRDDAVTMPKGTVVVADVVGLRKYNSHACISSSGRP
jgi:cytochrome P450